MNNSKPSQVLIGMTEGRQREDLARAIARGAGQASREITVTSLASDLMARAGRMQPHVILLEDRILDSGASFEEATRRLAAFAPVVVIGRPENRAALVGLVSLGEVDFAVHGEGMVAHAAALALRRLRASQQTLRDFTKDIASAWAADLPSDFGEILRHEFNNPLTGVLGNAELLLNHHRGSLPPVGVQRLETIVDLAVRLRESIRRLTVEWEREHPSLRSA
jgi:signal transduction histidine kinase